MVKRPSMFVTTPLLPPPTVFTVAPTRGSWSEALTTVPWYVRFWAAQTANVTIAVSNRNSFFILIKIIHNVNYSSLPFPFSAAGGRLPAEEGNPDLPTLRTLPGVCGWSGFTDFSAGDGPGGRKFFSALSSFKKSCFRISNNLLEGTLMVGMLFAVRELG